MSKMPWVPRHRRLSTLPSLSSPLATFRARPSNAVVLRALLSHIRLPSALAAALRPRLLRPRARERCLLPTRLKKIVHRARWSVDSPTPVRRRRLAVPVVRPLAVVLLVRLERQRVLVPRRPACRLGIVRLTAQHSPRPRSIPVRKRRLFPRLRSRSPAARPSILLARPSLRRILPLCPA